MMFKSIKERRKRSWDSLRPILMALFMLSGAAGLVYEVVWVRQLTLVLGASTHAVTVILAAFMSGLGIGSWFLGRYADRLDDKRLAKCYVLAEVGIGLFAVVLPGLLVLNKRLYVAFHENIVSGHDAPNSLRLIMAFLMFIVPTSLMGATLPILARYIIRSHQSISIAVSRLYALNTLGAVFGTVLAGYFLLPNFGNSITNLTAAAANLLIAIVFWNIHKRIQSTNIKNTVATPIVESQKEEKPSALQQTVMWAFAVSGAAAMFYEVAWTRTLSMILGTTTYAFTTMLATFLLGIAIGSAVYGKIRRITSAVNLFVWLELIIAFFAILSIPLFSRLPFLYLSTGQRFANSWQNVQFIRFFLASLIMIVPTIAMGCLFPVVSSIVVEKTGILGRRLGKAYGLNTFGAVIGAAAAGLVLIPMVGMQKAIIVGAFVNLLAGSAVCLMRSGVTAKYRLAPAACTALALIAFCWLTKPWSPKVMSSGVYAYAPRYEKMLDRVEDADIQGGRLAQASPWELWQMAMKQYELLYYNTGQAATVSVMQRHDGVRFLTVDGKTDASTNFAHDMKTQVLLGQLPTLFHRDPDSVFVVGLGSGVTVGSVLTHECVRVVDCAEFSEGVIEAAEYFSEVNHHALEDRRLEIIPRDARNVLMTSDKNYDVIVSQPSNPWISGQSTLFTVEWYRTVRRRLSKNGMFAQWVPAYHMSKHDVKIIINTLRSVFPHVTAWTSGSAGELIFVAKKGKKLTLSYEKLQKKLAADSVRKDIGRLGYDPETVTFYTFAMDEEDITEYLYTDMSEPVRMNTDNLLLTEFSTPKQMAKQHVVKRFENSDNLHGNIEALMAIIEDIDAEQIMSILN